MTQQTAIFAAGCFWGIEDLFMKTEGVINTTVGYIGGHSENPNYKEVCSGQTGHAEAVKIEFDAETISFEQLLHLFWRCHNPTTLNRQGPDIGSQYRSAIFYTSEAQKQQAEASKAQAQEDFDNPIVTEIVSAPRFYSAEDYHQKYFKKNGGGHCQI